MIKPTDRQPEYPGRVKLTPVAGQSGVYDMERADKPTQLATPLNRNTLQLLQGDIRSFVAADTGDEITAGYSVTVGEDGVSTEYIAGATPIQTKIFSGNTETAYYGDSHCAFALTENLVVIGSDGSSSVPIWRIIDSTTGEMVGHTGSSISRSGDGAIGCRIDDNHFIVACHDYSQYAPAYVAVVEFDENQSWNGKTKLVSGYALGSDAYPLAITFLSEDRIAVSYSKSSGYTGMTRIFSIDENYNLSNINSIGDTGGGYAIHGEAFPLPPNDNGEPRFAVVYQNGVGAFVLVGRDAWDGGNGEVYWNIGTSSPHCFPLFAFNETTIAFGNYSGDGVTFYKATYTGDGATVEQIGTAPAEWFKNFKSSTGWGSIGNRAWYFANNSGEVVTVRATDHDEIVVSKVAVDGPGSYTVTNSNSVCIMPDQSGVYVGQASSGSTYTTVVWRGKLEHNVFAPAISTTGTHAIALNSAAPGEMVRCLFSGVADAEWAKAGWKIDTEGVRGYSPADGFVAAQPYWWNVDDPDTISAQQGLTTAELDGIATQQAITDTELDTIATNQVYTDLELESLEQGQAQTELELMIVETAQTNKNSTGGGVTTP